MVNTAFNDLTFDDEGLKVMDELYDKGQLEKRAAKYSCPTCGADPGFACFEVTTRYAGHVVAGAVRRAKKRKPAKFKFIDAHEARVAKRILVEGR